MYPAVPTMQRLFSSEAELGHAMSKSESIAEEGSPARFKRMFSGLMSLKTQSGGLGGGRHAVTPVDSVRIRVRIRPMVRFGG